MSERVFRALVSPFVAFTRMEAAGGVLLMASAAVALVWSNSSWAASYVALWQTPVSVEFGGFALGKPLLLWINDGLMAVFFLLIGLEIKREVVAGELNSLRKAALPVAAAVGGMFVPAAVYLLVARDPATLAGWGVPVATDIAFALGVLLLLGSRAPLALKVFLTAVAIVDDLGAIMVISLFYTAALDTTALLAAGALFALALMGNRAGIRAIPFYGIVGAALWLAVLKSGVHATVAGVLLASTIPMGAGRNDEETGEHDHPDSPLHMLEHGLHPWVAFVVLPVFALANAGVALGGGMGDPMGMQITLGIVLGLVLGKPVGILATSWMAVRAGWADLPEGVNWRQLAGVGSLCGIGFTMSLFIGGLAFADPGHLDAAKVGVLTASLASALVGTTLLLTAAGRADTPSEPSTAPDPLPQPSPS